MPEVGKHYRKLDAEAEDFLGNFAITARRGDTFDIRYADGTTETASFLQLDWAVKLGTIEPFNPAETIH